MISGGMQKASKSSFFLGTCSDRAEGSLDGEDQPNKDSGDKLDDQILSLEVFEWNTQRDGSHWKQKQFLFDTREQQRWQ